MQVEWNNCFLCLNDLTGQVSTGDQAGGSGRKRKKETPKNENSCHNFTKRTELLFNYLLANKTDKLSGVISDIKQLLERKGDGGSGVKFCAKCEGQLRRVSELHRELEVVQMKLVSVLKAVKKTVVQNSRKDGGCGNVGLEIFEQWLREQESNCAGVEGNGEKIARLKGQRKILETLEAFQNAVMENDKNSTDIPLVFLERCTPFKVPPSEQLLPFPEVTVKTEMPELEDNLETPMSDHDEQLRSQAPEIEALKREYKKRFRPTDIDIKREVLRPPRASTSTARLKMIQMCKSYKKKKKEAELSAPPSDNGQPPARNYPPVPPSFQPKAHSKLKTVKPNRAKHLYCCALCPFTIRSLYTLEEHLQIHETEAASQENPPSPQFQCDQCPSKFRVEQAYEFHMFGHTGHHLILCESCNTWRAPLTFKDHMTSHLETTFPCPNCSYCCTTRDKYIHHLFLHHLSTSILECDICGVRSSGKQKFLEHYHQVHQAIEKLVCGVDGCSKEFLNASLLKLHRNVHTDRFKCSHCDKRFESQKSLNDHSAAVKGEKRWSCDQCPDSFVSRDTLQRHKMRVHDAPKFKCDICGKEFFKQYELTAHRRLHTGEAFPCKQPGCGKVFDTGPKLRRHTLLHSGERNFICDLCGVALKLKAQLKKHKRTHAGEAAKTFKCPECGMAFLFNQYLVNHLKMHKGDRSYICEACGKGFTQSASLHNHKKKCFLGPAPPVIQKRDERAKPIKIQLPLEDDTI